MGQSLAAMLLAASLVVSSATPKEIVQTAVTRVIAVLEGAELDRSDRGEPRIQPSDRMRVEIRRIAADLFDFEEMARRTLSRHWAGRTRAEQADFVKLFTDLLERSYVGRIEAYAGEKIVYVGETIDGKHAVVRSKIISPKRRQDTALEYRLHQRDGQWKVYDIVIDGVSFVSTYRAEFNRVISTSSYKTLADMLRNRPWQVKAVERRN